MELIIVPESQKYIRHETEDVPLNMVEHRE